MVYCAKCGVKNEDDAKFCLNCGIPLYPEKSKERYGDTCFGKRERHVEEDCFGLPYGGAIAGIIIGIFIIFLGLAIALRQDIWQWIGTFIILVIGTLIIAGAIYGLRRKAMKT